MIEVKYRGRMGNQLFQYCLARIIAESKGYELLCKPISGFEGTYENICGLSFTNNELYLSGQKINFENVLNSNKDQKIVLEGCFCRYEYFKDYRDKIITWLRMEPSLKGTVLGRNDVVIHVRGGDYRKHVGLKNIFSIARFKNHEKILDNENYENIYVVTDDPELDVVIDLQKKYGANIESSDAISDFKFIKSANNIIFSNSTFGWWAAYLSDAKNIHVICEGFFNENVKTNMDSLVDEDRYTYHRVI